MQNFNSFSPNSNIGVANRCTHNLVEGDRYGEITVNLESNVCVDCDEEEEWEALDLSGYRNIYLYIQKEYRTGCSAKVECVGVEPLTAGQAIFIWPEEILGNMVGKYSGEFEVRFTNGRIITTYQTITFAAREDFTVDGERCTFDNEVSDANSC